MLPARHVQRADMRKITVAVTVDDRMGIAFNKRRQSSDRVLIGDLVDMAKGKIYVSEYSASLFKEQVDKAVVVADPIKDCPDGGICFIEKTHVDTYIGDIESVIVYRWNRHYPSDMTLDLDLGGYEMVNSTEFIGSSHEKITKETYIKCK